MHLDRVVPVIRFVEGQRRVGSGYRICGVFVLTAAHCVRGRGLRVWLPDGERHARVVADGGPDVDLALVEITPAHGEAQVPEVTQTKCARVERTIPGRIGGCVAVGYPDNVVRPEAPFLTSEVDGWIPTGSGLADSAEGRLEGLLTLRAEGTPPRPLPRHETELGKSVWAGMSGAAVFARGLLVGVVAEHHLPEGDGSLTVVPIEWADRVTGAGRTQLMQALGIESVAGMARLTADAPEAVTDSSLAYSGIVTHAEEVSSLSGLRRNLRADQLPFVPPDLDDESHPDNLFSRLSELAGVSGVLLVGAAGTGKTRTCFEVADRSQAHGWAVLHVKVTEPAVTNSQLESAVERASSDQVLVIIDYLNECPGLNLLALRDWLPHAKSRGRRIALLACARPGWEATTDAPLSPLFKTVHLEHGHDQSIRIRDEIITSLAPAALSVLGWQQLTRLCGLRPVIAMLIALEAEGQAARGTLPPVLDGVRPEELIDWLNRRLIEDGLVASKPPDLLTDVDPSLDVQAIAAIMAAAPQKDSASLVECGGAAHEGKSEKAEDLLGVLQSMGWMVSDSNGISVVHDIVTDHVLERTFLRPASGTVRTATANRILSSCLTRGRTIGRYATSFGRLIRDLETENRATQSGKKLSEHCAIWFTDHAEAVGSVLASQENEGAYALGAVIENPAWSPVAFEKWSVVVAPWLSRHGTSLSARHLLYKGLAVVGPLGAGDLVSEALRWLDIHGTAVEASFVLRPLLERELDAGPAEAAVTHALTWLDTHPTVLEAQYVLGPLIVRKGLFGLSASFTGIVDHWLELHPSGAGYMSKYLVRKGEFTERIAAMIVEWARAHPGDEDIAWRLAGLAKKLDDYPALSNDFLTVLEISFRILADTTNVLNAQSEIDGLFEQLARSRATYCGLAAARLDDLILIWLSRPEALSENCSRGTYFTGLTSRIISLMYAGRFGTEDRAVMLDRLRTWIGYWKIPEDEVMRERSFALVSQAEEFFKSSALAAETNGTAQC